MSNVLNSSHIYCPYCGESLEILVDGSAGNHSYIEDCQVCCAPIEITVAMDETGEIVEILAQTDSE